MGTTQYSRRDFLRVSWTLGAGLVLPAGLYGCHLDSDSESFPPLPEETFVQPPTLASVDGALSVTLQLSYFTTVLNGKAVTLRSMNNRIPAPTLRVKVGDTLRILVVNQLPPNPPTVEPVQHLRYPNSTNLHTHGLHVTPGLVAPGVYGDFVMDDPRLGIQPGQVRQHEYRIGLDHPPGAYWYHPHLHGSTAIQIGSGMAGALMIKGEIDQVPEIAAAAERVFVFQSPITDAAGMLESFTQVADSPATEGPFLINGVRRPRIVMRRGEVQNWHFINAAIFNFVNLSLDEPCAERLQPRRQSAPQHVDRGPWRGRMASCWRRAIAQACWSRRARPARYFLRTLTIPDGHAGLRSSTKMFSPKSLSLIRPCR